jgi:hypothetical protein
MGLREHGLDRLKLECPEHQPDHQHPQKENFGRHRFSGIKRFG